MELIKTKPLTEEQVELRTKRIGETLKLDPTVIIMLKGKDYTLEFNNFAIKGILKDTGFNLMGSFLGTEEMENPEIMGAVLYYGLKTHHNELTQEECDKLYGYRHNVYILDKIREAIRLFLPDMSDIVRAEEGEGEEAKEPVNPPKPLTPSG